MTLTAATATPTRLLTITTTLADAGGWVLTIAREGHPAVTEPYHDWHRVERRIASLRQSEEAAADLSHSFQMRPT